MYRVVRLPLVGGMVSVVVALALGTSAQAASVQTVAAPVSLNSGAGFRPVPGTAVAKTGDKVMAGAGGEAVILYDNGCVERVEAGRPVVVKEAPACEGGALFGGDTGFVLMGVGLTAAVTGAIIAATGDDNAASP